MLMNTLRIFFLLAEQLLASHETLYSVQLVRLQSRKIIKVCYITDLLYG
jgi:hypothetical protein